jgi:hypothetical protein
MLYRYCVKVRPSTTVPSKWACTGNLLGFGPFSTHSDLPYGILHFLGFGWHAPRKTTVSRGLCGGLMRCVPLHLSCLVSSSVAQREPSRWRCPHHTELRRCRVPSFTVVHVGATGLHHLPLIEAPPSSVTWCLAPPAPSSAPPARPDSVTWCPALPTFLARLDPATDALKSFSAVSSELLDEHCNTSS